MASTSSSSSSNEGGELYGYSCHCFAAFQAFITTAYDNIQNNSRALNILMTTAKICRYFKQRSFVAVNEVFITAENFFT